MAGALRKMGVYLGLVEDDEHYAQYDDYDEADADGRPAEPVARGARREVVEETPRHSPRESSRVTAMQERRPSSAAGHSAGPVSHGATAHALAPQMAPAAREAYRITTIHPRTYNEARQIGEAFRDGTPVIMNLTEMSDSDAKRLVDFSAGLVFGLHGTIERVTSKVFLLSPTDVVVTAEDKARIAESGFFNQS